MEVVSGFMRKRIVALVLTAVIGFVSGGLISGCGVDGAETPEVVIEDHAVPLAQMEPTFVIPIPDAPGIMTESKVEAIYIFVVENI